MSVLAWDGVDDDSALFTPISSQLANLSNGAGTVAFIARVADANNGDLFGLFNSADEGFYRCLQMGDDDRLYMYDPSTTTSSTANTLAWGAAGAGSYRIVVYDWPSGAAAPYRCHWSAPFSGAESWTHTAGSGNGGGMVAGPGTTGRFKIGHGFGAGSPPCEIALVAVWAGVRLDDTGVEALWTNKKTSDWYNHASGAPTMLVECTSLTPTDIGANPSTFNSIIGGIALTGADPSGWTFDGIGGGPPQQLHPDSDLDMTGWTGAYNAATTTATLA